MGLDDLIDKIIREYVENTNVPRTKLTIPALGELQCLCRTEHHCEKHCTAGDHV